MSEITRGKFTIAQGNLSKQINFLAGTFSSSPKIVLTANENVNIYLTTITDNYFICNISNIHDQDIEVNYVAINND
jgi:hypothetical protein